MTDEAETLNDNPEMSTSETLWRMGDMVHSMIIEQSNETGVDLGENATTVSCGCIVSLAAIHHDTLIKLGSRENADLFKEQLRGLVMTLDELDADDVKNRIILQKKAKLYTPDTKIIAQTDTN